MEKRKAGRPIEKNAMRKVITIRMTEEEYAKISDYSQKSGKTFTQIAKEGMAKLYAEEPIS